MRLLDQLTAGITAEAVCNAYEAMSLIEQNRFMQQVIEMQQELASMKKHPSTVKEQQLTSNDPNTAAMLADPTAYFAKVRQAAYGSGRTLRVIVNGEYVGHDKD